MTNNNKIEYDYEPLLNEFNDYQLSKYFFFNESDKRRRDIEQDASDFNNEYYVWFNIEENGVKQSFENQYKLLTESKTYFYGCSFEIYKLTYYERLKSFLSDYIDASEMNFIERELNNEIEYDLIYYKTEKKIHYSIDLRKGFLKDKKTQLTTQPQEIKTEQTNSLNWQGTNLQFAELTKALIETKLISPDLTQKEFFKRMKQFFNVDVFNESDKLKEIRERTNTTTPLLNILDTSLNNWIKKKD